MGPPFLEESARQTDILTLLSIPQLVHQSVV